MNLTLSNLPVYASKNISKRAKNDPTIIDLSLGEPTFGPPPNVLPLIQDRHLTMDGLLRSVKRYEEARGSERLRESIARYYRAANGLVIDPATEIIVTHGGVEAITLAILCTSDEGESVAVTDPSYMLYRRAIATLGRRAHTVSRAPGPFEYSPIFADPATARTALGESKVLIINSPENPSGYVVDPEEWKLIEESSRQLGLWIIHDEVYDTMTFGRPHLPARAVSGLAERSILVNSCSKKFGMPGLRVGWIVSDRRTIDLACKLHDYLYLGVNILSEDIAATVLDDPNNPTWFSEVSAEMQARAGRWVNSLNEPDGFRWPRLPMGAMFAFPNVLGLYNSLPKSFRAAGVPVGDAVAEYLVAERKIAVVPGSVYGSQGDDSIRVVLCGASDALDKAIGQLRHAEL